MVNWNDTLCRVVCGYQRFGIDCCRYLQGIKFCACHSERKNSAVFGKSGKKRCRKARFYNSVIVCCTIHVFCIRCIFWNNCNINNKCLQISTITAMGINMTSIVCYQSPCANKTRMKTAVMWCLLNNCYRVWCLFCWKLQMCRKLRTEKQCKT